MDTFFSDEALLNKLSNVYQKNNKIIIAYDFDDTIAPTYMSKDCSQVIELLQKMRPYADFICFTSNENLDKVKEYIKENNIPCDCLNGNVPYMLSKYGNMRKVYFNILLDDKAGLGQAYRILHTFYDTVAR